MVTRRCRFEGGSVPLGYVWTIRGSHQRGEEHGARLRMEKNSEASDGGRSNRPSSSGVRAWPVDEVFFRHFHTRISEAPVPLWQLPRATQEALQAVQQEHLWSRVVQALKSSSTLSLSDA